MSQVSGSSGRLPVRGDRAGDPIIAIVPRSPFTLWRASPSALISLLIITNTLWGPLTVDSNLHDLFTLHKAGRLKRLLATAPHAIPAIFIGLRVGGSVIGAIVGEFFFRSKCWVSAARPLLRPAPDRF
jgi:ABC-type nitrate/sulfonate/bicarbonate transport system permease component